MASKFSRSGNTNVFGNLDVDIGKMKLPSVVKNALDVKAHKAGLNTQEYSRLVLTCDALGKDYVLSLLTKRINVVEGMGDIELVARR